MTRCGLTVHRLPGEDRCASPGLFTPLTTTLPVIFLAVSAAVWGLFWIPLRALEATGLPAGATVTGQFLMPVVIMAPVAVFLMARGRPSGLSRWHTGLFTGGAFALYADSLLLTEVSRALILFYVSPAWSMVLEIWLLKRRLTLARVSAIVLGFAGILVLLADEGGVPLPRNAGDWMAIVAGIFWAWGSTRVRMDPEASHFENVLSFFLYGSVIALALALVPATGLGILPQAETALNALPWLFVIAAVFLIPIMFMQLYACQHLDPARVGILLQIEVVVGIASAGILTAEPFGWREATGFALVCSSALTEVFVNRTATSRTG